MQVLLFHCKNPWSRSAHAVGLISFLQIRLYAQQRLSTTSEFWTVADEDFTELASMKQILTELVGARSEQELLHFKDTRGVREDLECF